MNEPDCNLANWTSPLSAVAGRRRRWIRRIAWCRTALPLREGNFIPDVRAALFSLPHFGRSTCHFHLVYRRATRIACNCNKYQSLFGGFRGISATDADVAACLLALRGVHTCSPTLRDDLEGYGLVMMISAMFLIPLLSFYYILCAFLLLERYFLENAWRMDWQFNIEF